MIFPPFFLCLLAAVPARAQTTGESSSRDSQINVAPASQAAAQTNQSLKDEALRRLPGAPQWTGIEHSNDAPEISPPWPLKFDNGLKIAYEGDGEANISFNGCHAAVNDGFSGEVCGGLLVAKQGGGFLAVMARDWLVQVRRGSKTLVASALDRDSAHQGFRAKEIINTPGGLSAMVSVVLDKREVLVKDRGVCWIPAEKGCNQLLNALSAGEMGDLDDLDAWLLKHGKNPLHG